MITAKLMVLKSQMKVDGTYNPKIVITFNKERTFIPTSVFTKEIRFKRGGNEWEITNPEIEEELNRRVRDVRNIISINEFKINQLRSSKEVKEFIVAALKKSDKIDLLAYADIYLSEIEVTGTYLAKKTRINSLKSYVHSHLGVRTLPVDMVTSSFIKNYEHWLRTHNLKGTGVKKSSTVISYIGELSTLFNACKNYYNNYDTGEVLIKHSPFRIYKYPKNPATIKKAVPVEVIRELWDYKPVRRTSEIAKDTFFISFFLCGMNVADIWECGNFTNRIEYTRKKTRNNKKEAPFLSLKIHKLIKPIINKYKDNDGEHGFVFHRYFRDVAGFHQSLRAGMKHICEEMNGVDHLTLYVARHTFATIARNDCDISIDDIALCLTHKSTSPITDVYIKKNFDRVDAIIDKVVSFVFGKG